MNIETLFNMTGRSLNELIRKAEKGFEKEEWDMIIKKRIPDYRLVSEDLAKKADALAHAYWKLGNEEKGNYYWKKHCDYAPGRIPF